MLESIILYTYDYIDSVLKRWAETLTYQRNMKDTKL